MALLAILLATCGLLNFTWWLLTHYKDAKVPKVVHFAVFLSWVLGFVGLLLLPMDLATNGLASNSRSKPEFKNYLLCWRLLYWVTFLLSWVVLPFLVEFRQNGEFELGKQVLSSLRQLFIHWTILAGTLLMVALYLVFIDHFSLYGVLGLAMATSSTYGLLWVIALLGYGLVEIPRGFWRQRFDGARFQKLYFQAVQLHNERMEARFEYEDVVTDVGYAYQRMIQAESDAIILTNETQYVKSCLLQVLALVEKSQPSFKNLNVAASDVQKGRNSIPWADNFKDKCSRTMGKAPSLLETIALHRRGRIGQLELRRSDQAFLELCIKVDILQGCSVERSLPARNLYPETSAVNLLYNFFLEVRHQLRRWFTYRVVVACAVFTSFLSTCIVWGELTMSWQRSPLFFFDFLLFAEATETSASPHIFTELVVIVVLVYLATCCYMSLFTLRLPGRYTLRAHGNSTELCLLKTSIYQCRLQFALGHNVLLLLHGGRVAEQTAFSALLASTRVVHVFGRGFTVYAPIAMIAFAGFTLSDGYARVMRWLGMEQYEQMIPGDATHLSLVTQGEKLVQQGLERYRVLISRKKNLYEIGATSGGPYGVTSAISGTQFLLDGEV